MTSAPSTTLWQRTTPVSRDRTSQLTREQIAAAAFGIAEAESLPAVSVKRVAGRLGIPGARLQQYLCDRADLLDLMVDVALGEMDDAEPMSADPDLTWQARLELLAHSLRNLVVRHPWLAGLLGLRAPTGPNGLRFTESSLATMANSGIDLGPAAQCVETVLSFVCGTVRPDALAASASGGTPPDQVARYLNEQMETGAFPLVGRLLATPSGMAAHDVFESGLGFLLAGMTATIGTTPPAHLLAHN